jgi:hypothetical protein
MTKMLLRLAAFVFGLGITLPAIAHTERQCWLNGRGNVDVRANLSS